MDFPQPEGPTKTVNSPSLISRSKGLMTWRSPKFLVTCFNSIYIDHDCVKYIKGALIRTLVDSVILSDATYGLHGGNDDYYNHVIKI